MEHQAAKLCIRTPRPAGEGSARAVATRAFRAFTLVELMVCIAVIGILAALLAPALAGGKARGNALACLNNLRQLSLACAMYVDDFGDRLPYNYGYSDIQRTTSRNRYYNWSSPVMSWELDPDNTNVVELTKGGIGPYTGPSAGVYRCPDDRIVSDIQAGAGWTERVRSISMNAMIGNAGQFTRGGTNVNNPGYVQFFRTTQIRQAADIFIFIDEHPDSINDGYFLNTHHSGRWTDLPASYHSGAANLTFADGHAERHKWDYPSTRPPARPDAAGLPFRIPSEELGDFEWLMERTSVDL